MKGGVTPRAANGAPKERPHGQPCGRASGGWRRRPHPPHVRPLLRPLPLRAAAVTPGRMCQPQGARLPVLEEQTVLAGTSPSPAARQARTHGAGSRAKHPTQGEGDKGQDGRALRPKKGPQGRPRPTCVDGAVSAKVRRGFRKRGHAVSSGHRGEPTPLRVGVRPKAPCPLSRTHRLIHFKWDSSETAPSDTISLLPIITAT